VALALHVYGLTGSASQVSFAIALELMPYVVIGPLGGVLADRLDRKTVLVSAYLAQTVVVALLPLTTAVGQVYVLVFAGSLLAPVAELVRAASLPALVGQRLFVRGSSLDILAYNAVNVVGPPLAGIVVSLIGARPAFVIAAACSALAVLLALRIGIPSPPRSDRRLRLRMIGVDLLEAMRGLMNHRLLRFLLLLSCTASLGWAASDVAAVVYLTENLGLEGGEYGLIRGAVSLGMALSVYFLGRFLAGLPRRQILVGGVVIAGIAYALVGFSPGLLMVLTIWFVSGLGWGAYWLVDNAYWAEATPDDMRGRVYSISLALISSVEVGMVVVIGLLVDARGPIVALVSIGAIVTVAAIAVAGMLGAVDTNTVMATTDSE
jgi:NRE family putative nickel resistance protein-like MFS transporter